MLNTDESIFNAIQHLNNQLFIFIIPEFFRDISRDIDILSEIKTAISDPLKLKFLIKILEVNQKQFLEINDEKVVLMGGSCDKSQILFWYESSLIEKPDNVKVIRETISIDESIFW